MRIGRDTQKPISRQLRLELASTGSRKTAGCSCPVKCTLVGRRCAKCGKDVEVEVCECGHRPQEHKETMPGKLLCMGCLADPDNIVGCETYIRKAVGE